ncbi:hypothetical protein OIU34_32400 [Pararhizobium sp. BT-229]|uniref:hypothetical protein n=1 Tax=Pararhizobium sp. BT-229 TaxID=2986923 RepID=UPI0021F6A3D9|nr:hypothetical protein [Pararhizobium sp. BT-229]MCV9966579.1 hypothetical protein [Pararhizobium sp. BT-229]
MKRIRLPRKVMFVIAGVLVLCGASGALAVYSAKDVLLGSAATAPSRSGLACTTVETLKMRRNGQRWIRKYVSTETAEGVDRVRTALRITGLITRQEKADLYHVVVLDHAGPTERAAHRGPAIGAEVLFAPDPTKLPGMTASFIARYNEGKANTVGLFYGREVALSTDEIKKAMTAMDDKSDCLDPAPDIGAAGSEAGAHGEDAAAGHGEAPLEHGADAEASEHGAEPEHNATKAEEKSFFGSMMAMVWGESAPSAGDVPGEHSAEKPEGETAAGH